SGFVREMSCTATSSRASSPPRRLGQISGCTTQPPPDVARGRNPRASTRTIPAAESLPRFQPRTDTSAIPASFLPKTKTPASARRIRASFALYAQATSGSRRCPSFVAERFHRVHFRRSQRGNVARRQRHDSQERRHTQERDRVGWLHAKE